MQLFCLWNQTHISNASSKFSIDDTCHLNLVKDLRYRVAITQLSTGSHVLNIERGRYQIPKVLRDLRLCRICNVVEDEEHFVTSGNINHGEWSLLYSNMTNKAPHFGTLSDKEKIFLITSNDPQILTWFIKFLHRSFIIRNEALMSNVNDWGECIVMSKYHIVGDWGLSQCRSRRRLQCRQEGGGGGGGGGGGRRRRTDWRRSSPGFLLYC